MARRRCRPARNHWSWRAAWSRPSSNRRRQIRRPMKLHHRQRPLSHMVPPHCCHQCQLEVSTAFPKQCFHCLSVPLLARSPPFLLCPGSKICLGTAELGRFKGHRYENTCHQYPPPFFVCFAAFPYAFHRRSSCVFTAFPCIFTAFPRVFHRLSFQCIHSVTALNSCQKGMNRVAADEDFAAAITWSAHARCCSSQIDTATLNIHTCGAVLLYVCAAAVAACAVRVLLLLPRLKQMCEGMLRRRAQGESRAAGGACWAVGHSGESGQ